MSLYDLLIRNGILVSTSGTELADLAITDGQVVEVASELQGSAREEIDASGLYIFPGVIDAHLHFNEPGRTHWEGFATGTSALAAGGTTAFFDMPLNASPPTLDAHSFVLKRQSAQATSLVDFGLWGGLVPDNLSRLEELAECGVVGFKAFMSNSGIEDFTAVDDTQLYAGMSRAARLNKLVAVHAEDEQLTSQLARQAQQEGRTGIRDYLASRPVVAELNAIQRAIEIAEETGCELHIVHVSSGRGVMLVVEARARGVRVSCETCPHYLALTEEDVERLGAVAKCAPPVRNSREQEMLWEQVMAGNVPMIASDHSPAPIEMKASENFFQVWGGISGCQSLLLLLLTEGYAKRKMALSMLTSLTAEYVARRFHIPRKGRLAVGYDADLVLVDLGAHEVLRKEHLYYRHQHSPYVGKLLQGRVIRTLVRGITVYQEGHFNPEARGQLLQPVWQKP